MHYMLLNFLVFFLINYATIALHAKKQNKFFFIISALILSSRIKIKFLKIDFNRIYSVYRSKYQEKIHDQII